ncbi:MAG: DNA repair protein RecO [Rickettsiaceae bacterium]
MHFSDKGIIISKKPLKENSYIVTVFTQSHGIYSGVLKQYSKKTGDRLVEGNLVDFAWHARLHEHLGSVKIELIRSYNSYLLLNKMKLYAFNSAISLLKKSFGEREPHNSLFPFLLSFLESLKKAFSFQHYIHLELAILSEAGYKLQLDHCIVTGQQDNLYYVSPKSGQAVSKAAGDPYSNKLLRLPQFLLDDVKLTSPMLQDAFTLTSYFFNRYIFVGQEIPLSRNYFCQYAIDVLNQ